MKQPSYQLLLTAVLHLMHQRFWKLFTGLVQFLDEVLCQDLLLEQNHGQEPMLVALKVLTELREQPRVESEWQHGKMLSLRQEHTTDHMLMD